MALYLNNQHIEKKQATNDQYSSHLPYPPFIFDLAKFESGTLKAEGFIAGQKVTEDIVKSPKQAKSLLLTYDLSGVALSKDQADVVFVYARTVDENSTLINDASKEVTFTLEGSNAILIGTNPVNSEAGIATILLRTNSFESELIITAESEG